jgi:uncharacterized protein
MSELDRHREEINLICFNNKVKSLYAFGSVTGNQFNDNSDIDLVVDILENDPLFYSDLYFNLKFQLEQLFRRPIDLLEERAIKNPFLINQIERTKMMVYAA